MRGNYCNTPGHFRLLAALVYLIFDITFCCGCAEAELSEILSLSSSFACPPHKCTNTRLFVLSLRV